MREPRAHHRIFGLVAEFDDPDALIAAARAARAEGYSQLEAFSPYPVEGLAEALGFRERIIAPVVLGGGVFGAAAGLGLQVYTNLDYPLNVGGRPLLAWPAFALIGFELLVLCAVVAGILAMLLLNRLPRLNHPLFELESFHFATSDKFFLAVLANDARFDEAKARGFLQRQDPLRVDAAPFSEEPE